MDYVHLRVGAGARLDLTRSRFFSAPLWGAALAFRDRVRQVGSLSCRVCGAAFNRMINKHDEGIDVFGDWIDACVAANAQAAKEAEVKLQQTPSPQQQRLNVPPLRTASAASAEQNSDADGGAQVSRRTERGSESRPSKRSLRVADPDDEDLLDAAEDGAAPPPKRHGKRLKLSEERRRDTVDDEDLESPDEQDQDAAHGDDAAVADTLELYRQQQQNEDDGDDAGSLFHDDE